MKTKKIHKTHWYLVKITDELFLNRPFVKKEDAQNFKFSDEWKAYSGESMNYMAKAKGFSWKELRCTV